MNSQELFQRVTSCHVSDYKQHIGEYLNSHCDNPRRMWLYNPHTGKREERTVACGCCFHCRETKINEWVARMYYHLDDYANAYFVTLTYRTLFNPRPGTPDFCLAEELRDAVWHKDAYNSRGTNAYRPCVLVKKHYQDFLKRLRKATGYDITYAACGEYGSKWANPHFHFILFTKAGQRLTGKMIQDAWSLKLVKRADGLYHKAGRDLTGVRRLPLGRTQLIDLVAAGNFDQYHQIEGQSMNGRKCFAYVAKYIAKKSFNDSRVRLAYSAMTENGSLYEPKISEVYQLAHSLTRQQIFGFDPWKQKVGAVSPVKSFGVDNPVESFHRISYKILKLPQGQYVPTFNNNLTNLKFQFYEELPECLHFPDSLYPNSLGKISVNSSGCIDLPYREDYDSYLGEHLPFFECSRSTSLGSLFCKNHLQELAQGVIRQPTFKDAPSIYPTYFRNQVRKHLYGLRRSLEGFSGRSYSLGNLPLLRADLEACSRGEVPYNMLVHPVHFTYDPSQDHDVLTDICTGVRFIPKFLSSGGYCFECYRFDRGVRRFVNIGELTPQDFADYFTPQLDAFERYHQKMDALRLRNEEFLDRCKVHVRQSLEFTNVNAQIRDFDDIVNMVLEERLFLQGKKQIEYEQTHEDFDE